MLSAFAVIAAQLSFALSMGENAEPGVGPPASCGKAVDIHQKLTRAIAESLTEKELSEISQL
ncbi:hypothetical protein [Rhizobium leguminosarum]|uniref:Uncharacterized protein n=1 Tax=Rhizobium leguminosarum TaxID=384 RepID=A0A1B1CHT7_RHILE|nr:hypothetical protein [Rhizobium leguminosarum]ANP89322.1 hypothetical protein BA011_26495 [Rhizobium leguminosarum]